MRFNKLLKLDLEVGVPLELFKMCICMYILRELNQTYFVLLLIVSI